MTHKGRPAPSVTRRMARVSVYPASPVMRVTSVSAVGLVKYPTANHVAIASTTGTPLLEI